MEIQVTSAYRFDVEEAGWYCKSCGTLKGIPHCTDPCGAGSKGRTDVSEGKEDDLDAWEWKQLAGMYAETHPLGCNCTSCVEYHNLLNSKPDAAQLQPARTDEKTAWAAILRWAYENSPDAVVSINRLATEVVEARAICAELAALRQSLDECVVALENAKIGLEACGMGCPYIDNALTAAKHLIAPLDKQG